MKLTLALLLWLALAAVLATGVVRAVQGHVWLLVAGLLGFGLAFVRIGCRTH